MEPIANHGLQAMVWREPHHLMVSQPFPSCWGTEIGKSYPLDLWFHVLNLHFSAWPRTLGLTENISDLAMDLGACTLLQSSQKRLEETGPELMVQLPTSLENHRKIAIKKKTESCAAETQASAMVPCWNVGKVRASLGAQTVTPPACCPTPPTAASEKPSISIKRGMATYRVEQIEKCWWSNWIWRRDGKSSSLMQEKSQIGRFQVFNVCDGKNLPRAIFPAPPERTLIVLHRSRHPRTTPGSLTPDVMLGGSPAKCPF